MWFKEDPERYEAELHYLREAGFEFYHDDKKLEAGQLVLFVQYSYSDGDNTEEHKLTVIFPFNYPTFPFQIIAPSFPKGRHKDPYRHNLCLLTDLQQKWDGTKDTLASFLDNQVADILRAHRDEQVAPQLEGHEALRPSGYLEYDPGKILVGDWIIPPEVDHGTMAIALDPGSEPNKLLRGAAIYVLDNEGNQVASLDAGNWNGVYHDKNKVKTLRVRWVRLPAAPEQLGKNILDEAIAAWPEIERPKFRHGPDIIGLLFPEEHEYKGTCMGSWAFVVRKKYATDSRQPSITYSVVRSEQLSPAIFQARIPRVTPLANARVLVVGLGALGSNIAWQLARAGLGALNCLDRDILEVGNLPRWLMGFDAVGLHKAEAVARYLLSHYPYVKVHTFIMDVGSTDPRTPKSIEEALDGVDVIVDATAEWAVNLYFSDLARNRELPYVWATGTPGSWGGTVGRVIPGGTKGCWSCFQWHMYEGAIPSPPQEKSPYVQPPGCFHPTFTGTGFDMDSVALMATRLTVATLCAGRSEGYPDFDWNAGILSLWEPNKDIPIAPHWHTVPLDRHPQCPHHE